MRKFTKRHISILVPLLFVSVLVVTAALSTLSSLQVVSASGHAAMAPVHYSHARAVLAPNLASRTPSEPFGIPAITPSLDASTAMTATYRLDDVRQFAIAHPFRTTDGSQPTIARILFISASQASALMHGESVGRSPTTLVCYVELHGLFTIGRAFGPPVQGSLQPDAHIGDMVFDVRTGNLLVAGFDG